MSAGAGCGDWEMGRSVSFLLLEPRAGRRTWTRGERVWLELSSGRRQETEQEGPLWKGLGL